MNAIGVCGNHNGVLKLAVENGANPKGMTDTYHLALWFEGAPAKVKLALCKLFDKGNIYEHGLRICSNCGRWMIEGYILEGMGFYACSEECAIDHYCAKMWHGEKAKEIPSCRKDAEVQLEADLENYPDDNFWTEWYQEL